jgi:hypothetical protein
MSRRPLCVSRDFARLLNKPPTLYHTSLCTLSLRGGSGVPYFFPPPTPIFSIVSSSYPAPDHLKLEPPVSPTC